MLFVLVSWRILQKYHFYLKTFIMSLEVDSDFIAKFIECCKLEEKFALKTMIVGAAGLAGYLIGGKYGAAAAAGLVTTYITDLHANIMELINKLTPEQKRALCAAILMILKQFNLPPVVEKVIVCAPAVTFIVKAINSAIKDTGHTICVPNN